MVEKNALSISVFKILALHQFANGLPWLLTMLVFLVIVTYWPDLTLFLPRLLGMH